MRDDIMVYWLPNASASSARIYCEMNQVHWDQAGTLDAPSPSRPV
ncbi:hypothetical protein [uncultured Friedmanniella sp.]